MQINVHTEIPKPALRETKAQKSAKFRGLPWKGRTATQTQDAKDYYHIIPDYFKLFFIARQTNKKIGPKKKQTNKTTKTSHNPQIKKQTKTVTMA